MLIIPAIDIKEGKCVRLREGQFSDTEVFSDDPIKVALNWADKGAEMLHIVDLDGARYGKLTNISLVEKMIKKMSIPVQVGGGIRSYQEVKNLINLGASRVILGTILWKDKTLAEKLFEDFSEKIVAGIDARDGYVAIEGWQNVLSIDALDFAGEIERLGARRIIYSDIKRDGTLKGPNITNIEKMLKNVNIPLICSGGIASLNDIKKLKKIKDSNLEGIIIGKALYKGRIILEEALKLVVSE
ncbi:1-(5-phosphoribosyl)-5-[(5-phosphoribosylamino)methylideneamino]imidazole-4-carboxamide isomerase [Candidatus Atribacteria bacterium RBG_19FT_COMBO_35_14]|uniref:1-(5-phosphoribosyl)-5-[(5-phosphoribosylamino)methylideneamino] imidazole-4-carboxamide isomerase n=1 Tax=Candidatus Sediminicultor quintus TaxID=1797291 RepID=A0A1F5AEH7_9BACT|nr:MAG: 1-(5-phosphoribosyl)-5-[(5-phosphoribosylamino)methylideneamino]imidazole-4-carboxamide isomerase [Candidatus Atribacteria bacterium RBG_19FT_COMBO_35_14]